MIVPFSEEFRKLIKWLQKILQQNPNLKVIIYPLTLLLVTAALWLIGNSLVSLFTSIKFSYD